MRKREIYRTAKKAKIITKIDFFAFCKLVGKYVDRWRGKLNG
jgi:hypothetical protein